MTTSYRARRLAAAVAAMLVGGGIAEAHAQAVIRGRVTSESQQPLSGASVGIPTLNIGTQVGPDGSYTITVPQARITSEPLLVRARAIGYKPGMQTVTLRQGTQTVDFALQRDVVQLEAVVTTGVATATVARNVPFAITQMDTSQMPVVGGNAVQQLQGKIAGATITAASGRPGAAPSVVLRGPTSINASGRGQGPLYIVDGILLNGSTPDINPNDIETIEVVKGAAAASLYGSRGAGGVITITTKRGRATDGITFGARTEVGTSDIPHEFLIAKQTFLPFDPSGKYLCAAVTSGGTPCARYVDMETERLRINDVSTPHAAAPQAFLYDGGIAINPERYRLLNQFQANTHPRTYNQVDQATKNDLWTNSNVDMQGRFGNTRFFGSAGYMRQAGAFEYLRGYERSTARLNVDQVLGKLSLQSSTLFSVQREDGGNQEGGTGFFRLSRQPAFVNQHVRDSQGRLYIRSNPLNQGSQNDNPMYWLESYDQNITGTRYLGSLQAKYAALDWLNFDAAFAYDRGMSRTGWLQDRGYRSTAENPALAVGNMQFTSSEGQSLNTNLGMTLRPQLLSNLTSGFNFDVAYQGIRGDSHYGYGENLAVPNLYTLGAAVSNKDIGSSFSDVRTLSYRATADLAYLDRYILSVSTRHEGSSLFGAEQRWQTFPRVAASWIMSDESWFPSSAIGLFKLRGNWGKAGNPPSFSAQYETFSVSSSTGALSPGTLGNSQLRPEIMTDVEVGADVELFNRYGLQVTYSKAVIDDQILNVPAPAGSGFPNQWRNAGQLTSKTWEASLEVPIIERGALRWSTRLIYDRNRAVITKLLVPPYNTTGGVQGTESMFFVREGERLGTIYGGAFVTSCGQLPANFASQCGGSGAQFTKNADGFIVWNGGFPLTEGVTRNLWNASLNAADAPWGSRAVWGMPIRLRDSTGNVAQVPLGNSMQDWHGGLSSNLSWKKLTAYGLLDGFFGRKVFNEGYHWALGDFMSGTLDQGGKSVEDARPIGYYFRAGPGVGGSTGVGGLYNALGPSNESTEDASYVKLREASLQYNVGPVAGRGNWTIGVVGRNLYTWTKYRGYDPEVGRAGGTQLNNAALVGVDYFTFPNLRTFTVQLSTAF